MPIQNNLDIRELNLWEKLLWNVLPNRCVLCGKWKLWGKNPHLICRMREEYLKSKGWVKLPPNSAILEGISNLKLIDGDED